MEETSDKYFLQKVYLSGYKSIRETTIDFQSNLNIIIGKNAAGKTNFLWFLNKVLNNDLDNMYNFRSALTFTGKKNITLEAQYNLTFEMSEPNKSFSKKQNKFVVKVDDTIKEYNDHEDPELLVNFYNEEGFSCFSTLISHGIPDNYALVDKPAVFTVENATIDDLLKYQFKAQHPYFIKCLLMSFSLGRNAAKTSIEKIKLHVQERMTYGLDNIKPFLKQLSPIEDIRFNENFNIFKSEATEKLTFNNLFIEFKVNGEWLPFSNLSDGTKRLFYIISEVAYPDVLVFTEKSISTAEKISRIILIEEPELGIHPHQLHGLMLFLKEQSKKKQIIITTHSPQVLDILNENELNSIILAYHENKKGTLLRHLSDEEVKKAKKYIEEDFLSDYWMHSDLETANPSNV